MKNYPHQLKQSSFADGGVGLARGQARSQETLVFHGVNVGIVVKNDSKSKEQLNC
ncbi:hypothetical protein AM1_4964 [Acaryochloris marina MBIC11017]|uniref:Uncharacterized protein n=1 Tax=Acaryochloris marina (strain MBIC 11017) TaxID=329726 RepID=B0C4Q2_ACAM1|nr:hypothetical protein AM1_4964 [Acaryochloris marina MBIC11017]